MSLGFRCADCHLAIQAGHLQTLTTLQPVNPLSIAGISPLESLSALHTHRLCCHRESLVQGTRKIYQRAAGVEEGMNIALKLGLSV